MLYRFENQNKSELFVEVRTDAEKSDAVTRMDRAAQIPMYNSISRYTDFV